ncbi:MAG: ABC transporter ATP-binding protein [Rhodospirillaceae bacterium]|nr:ABC transporter ATP-binding protein [Rhodospirillaceae bacterium]|tara:strand:+ start:153 stop:929 length:777 start_codon:yes stop_codon:yes gene_type:complete
MMETLIDIDGVGKTFTGQDGEQIIALEGTDLKIGRGEFVSIVGPSGCGKSTLLSLVAGLLETTIGEVRISGSRVDGPYTDLGFAFQSDLLLDWRTVLRNVLLQCDMRGIDNKTHEPRARELLRSVGLEGFEDKRPFELSGGMRQRVALCRALLLDPPMLMMDEPFGALDALTREQMQVDLLAMWQETKKTVLFVTHSISEAVFLSDRIIVMTPRPGKVREIIDIDISRPRDLNVRDTGEFGAIVHRIRLLFQEMGVIH